jgi:hypothetical protein
MYLITNAGKLLSSAKQLINVVQVKTYAARSRNILRNRYNYRNSDGTYKEYNESIQIIPKELEKHGK